MKSRFAAVGLTILLAISACSVPQEGGGSASAPAPADPASSAAGGDFVGCEGAKIAYITPGMSIPFWRSLSVGIKQEAEKAGASVTDYDSKLSQSTQLQNAQDAITAGVDVIIISPTDSAAAPAVLEVAEQSNIPVIIADIGTNSGTHAAFIATDNIGGAASAGEYLVEQLQAAGKTSGKIGIIGISQTRQNGKDRTQGFTDVVTAAGYEVLPLLESQDYTRSEGLTLAQDLIAGNPDMIALFTEHDEATLGAVEALKTTQRTDILLVGFDGSPDTLAGIKAQEIGGAAMQQPVLMGNEAAKAACQVLAGETPAERIDLPTILVTKDNVDQTEAEVMDTVFAE